MNIRSKLAAGFTAAAVCVGLLWNDGGRAKPEGSRSVLAAEAGKLRWYRGNLHTHTYWSDGDDFPEMVTSWYREHGYQFLAITDHNTIHNKEKWVDVKKIKAGKEAFDKLKDKFPAGWIEQRQRDGLTEVRLKRFTELESRFNAPGQFLLIEGEEVTDKFGSKPVHLCATNVQEQIDPRGGDSVYEVIQRNTDALAAQRQQTGKPMFIHLNHPNFGWGVTAEDMMRVRGERFFEVYNGHPGVNNDGDATRASTERIWDIINTKRVGELGLPLTLGLATDDGHNYHKIPSRGSEPGRGWVMVLSDELSHAALIAAMDVGRVYSSSGVTLKRVESSAQSIEVEVEAQPNTQYEIEFIGTRRGYDPEGKPVTVLDKDGKPLLEKDGKPFRATMKYTDSIGAVLEKVSGTSAKYIFKGDELYVRARITSTKEHPNPSRIGEFERAWIQPALGSAAKP